MPTAASLGNWLSVTDQNADVVFEDGSTPVFTRQGGRVVVKHADGPVINTTKTLYEQTEEEVGEIDPADMAPRRPVPGSPASSYPAKKTTPRDRSTVAEEVGDVPHDEQISAKQNRPLPEKDERSEREVERDTADSAKKQDEARDGKLKVEELKTTQSKDSHSTKK